MKNVSMVPPVSYYKFTSRPLSYSFLLIILFIGTARASQPLVLKDSLDQYIPTHSIEYFVDSSATLSIEDVASPKYRARFIPVKGAAPSFAPSQHAIWVAIDLIDSTTAHKIWKCSFSYAVIDTIVLYGNTAAAWNAIQMWNGYDAPDERGPHHRLPIFQLPPMPHRHISLVFRLTSVNSIPLLMYVRTDDNLHRSELHDQFMLGGFYGILMIMIVYNLFLYFSVRDSSYLLYGLYAGCFGFYEFIIDGLYREYFNQYFNFQHRLIIFPIYVSVILGVLFARKYLNTKQLLPTVDRMLQLFLYAIIVLTLIILFIPMQIIDRSSAIIGSIFLLVCILTGIFALRAGFKPAVYYLLAVSGFTIGMLLRSLRVTGVLPMTEFIQNAVQIGFLWEVSIFSFALGNRINTLREEKDREKEQIRLRIADDLHDEIGSNLSSIVVQSQLMKRDPLLEAEHSHRLDEISEIAVETGESMRDIVWFIDPEHDDPNEMTQKMKDTVMQLVQCDRIDVQIDPSVFRTMRDLQMRRNLFFIFKEALNNIVRHAKASKVSVSLKKVAATAVLEIEDNGCGFDEKGRRGGHGLQSFRNRAKQMNAEFDLKSSPGGGTSLQLRIKIP